MSEVYQPLVSVYVVTYNSSKTVIETLDSIYNQTYPNIELMVSDDCSTDNTVELCREWIEGHKDRFVRTELLTVEKNTGVSGNCNRAEAACQGEWVKGIAGDDLLVEDCIETCVDYVGKNEKVVVLFGKQDAFGADENICKEINGVFDYEMLQQSSDKQLHKLIYDGNYIPATTLFYHRERMRATGIICDPRIPLLDDWPKWINLLRAGVKFHFVDKVLVRYRVGGISNGGRATVNYYRTCRLFELYYIFPEMQKINYDEAVLKLVQEDIAVYDELLKVEKELHRIQSSYAYRLGKCILKPFKLFLRK